MEPGYSSLLKAVLGKRETTPYTDSNPSASYALASFQSFQIDPDLQRIDKENLGRRTFGGDPAMFDQDASFCNLKFDTPAFRPAAPGAKPTVAEFLFACGLKEVITAGVSATYSNQTPPNTYLAPSSTIVAYEGGQEFRMIGARGTFGLKGSAKDGVVFSFDLASKWSQTTVVSPPVQPALPSSPITFSTASIITSNNEEIDISAIDFSLGNNLVKNQSSVGARVYIDNFKPVLKINPVTVASTSDWYRIINAQEFELNASFNNGALVLNFPRCVMVKSAHKDSAGRVSREREFECCEDGNGVRFSLTFK